MKLPRWLSKANFDRLQTMEPDEAEAELARRYEAEKERKRAWRAANKEKAAAMAREWRKRNPKAARAAYKRCREAIKADPERRARTLEVRREWIKRTGHKRPPITKEQERRYDVTRYQRSKTRRLALQKPDELRKIIQQYLPGYLPPPARMDIINSVMELALDHKVRHDELAQTVKQCVTAYNRQFDHFKNLSIDAPIAGADGLTRADLLDSEAFHF